MERKLKLKIQPHIIDHLGIKMYQKVADVVSEFVANAWDADATLVEVTAGKDSISIADNGHGMTFEECQEKFLTVGRDRRVVDRTDRTRGGRPVLGRKGIGKFAGFGVAKRVIVTTSSDVTGEETGFELDVDKILLAEANDTEIEVIGFKDASEKRKSLHGTRVQLLALNLAEGSCEVLAKELSRRFLLVAQNQNFDIRVNGAEIPETFSEEMEYEFPSGLTEEELGSRPGKVTVDAEGWAAEKTSYGFTVKWRIGFTQKPIDEEDLRGVAIFARGKMAQKPFFFDFSGGMSAQQGLEYLTGQVVMDFIDEGSTDLIATERQRINLQTHMGENIREWGIGLLRFLCGIWAKRRSQKKVELITSKTEPFAERIASFPKSERKTVMCVLEKIASFSKLSEKRFREWANDIVTSYENGRLRNVIDELATSKELDESSFINILAEADVLASLNIAESVKTKVTAIGELKLRVQSRELENKVRDYIYANPWIVHPKWEGFKKERSLDNLITDLGAKVFKGEAPYNGRVDLALSAGTDLLIIEFMRPGLELDFDHLDRLNRYVMEIRNAIKTRTGERIRSLNNAYIVADKKIDNAVMDDRIRELSEKGILVQTWNGLITNAVAQWQDTLTLLKSRHPSDKRITCL